MGGIFKPYQIKRVAKAEAEATLIKAQTEIQITDLHRRAMHRFVEEEANRQKNIEDITAKALPKLNDKADPSKVEDDWIVNFFDKCRIVSDNEMQNLWSRVLAGESNSPGTYSKRTVNFLSDLDKGEAEQFTRLCGFEWTIDSEIAPLIYDEYKHQIYKDQGINFDLLRHLESIGLIRFSDIEVYLYEGMPKKLTVLYYGTSVTLEMPSYSSNEINVGHVLFTKIGKELAPICGSKPVDGFLEYVIKKWKGFKYLPEDKPEQSKNTTNN
ncbi:MAG: DUF2806 domain-containing protein [Sedimentisphaerales bacterium]